MIYNINEYKEKAIEAERMEFAKRYALVNNETAKKVLEIHRKFTECIEDYDFLRALYDDYLIQEGYICVK